MSKRKEPLNPFYLIAMAFGLGFTITACAFGVLMVRANRSEGLPEAGQSGYGLMDLLNRHGMAILVGELVGLALFSFAAIYLDHVRGVRERAARQSDAHASEPGK